MKAEKIRHILNTAHVPGDTNNGPAISELLRLEEIAIRTEQVIREIGHAISSTLEECELHGYTDEQIAYVKGLRWVQGRLEGWSDGRCG